MNRNILTATGVFFILMMVVFLGAVTSIDACGDSIDCRPTSTPEPTVTPTPVPSAINDTEISVIDDNAFAMEDIFIILVFVLSVITLMITIHVFIITRR